jgi:hypothetical protein
MKHDDGDEQDLDIFEVIDAFKTEARETSKAKERPTKRIRRAIEENLNTTAGKVTFKGTKSHVDHFHFSERDFVRLEDGATGTVISAKSGWYSIQVDGETSVRAVALRASSLKAATRPRHKGSSKDQTDGKEITNQVRQEKTAQLTSSTEKGLKSVKPKASLPAVNKNEEIVQEHRKHETKREDKEEVISSKRFLLPGMPDGGSITHDAHPKDLLMHEVFASVKLQLALHADASYSDVATEAATALGLQYPEGATMRQKLNLALLELRNV